MIVAQIDSERLLNRFEQLPCVLTDGIEFLLLDCIEECETRGIGMYGGGQFELGPGRRQIQLLASLFYADGPNDVAPSAYNEGPARPGLPQSPLPLTNPVAESTCKQGPRLGAPALLYSSPVPAPMGVGQ